MGLLSLCMRQIWEGQIGPIVPWVPTPLDNILVLDVQSAHVTKTGPRNRVGILLQSEMLKMDYYFHNDIFILPFEPLLLL